MTPPPDPSAASPDLLASVFEAIRVGLIVRSDDRRLLACNAAAMRILGVSRAEIAVGKHFESAAQTVLEDGRPANEDEMPVAVLRRTGRAVRDVILGLRRPDRFALWVSVTVIPLAGPEPGIVISFCDVTLAREAEATRDESEAKFAGIVESSLDAIIAVDEQQRILLFNPAAAHIFRCSARDALGQSLERFVPQRFRAAHAEHVQAYAQSGRTARAMGKALQLGGLRADGEEFALEASISQFAVGGRVCLVVTLRDISERIRAELELTRLMTHDSVTGLKRYVAMRGEIDKLVASDASRSGITLLSIDLDRFRTVNESLGYEVGDLALKVCAERLLACVASAESISRLGGDEFLVVLTDTNAKVDPLQIADQIRAAIEKPIAVGTFRIYLTCSIGISRYPEHGSNATALLHAADAAMTRAQSRGRNSIAVFSLAQASALNDRLALGGLLRDAISSGEMVLHYQPLVRASTGQVTGVEALVRWESPELGLLPPARFIQVAEELGLIIELGHWVLEEACRQIKRWTTLGHTDFFVAVNVSAHQLNRPEFAGEVSSILNRAGVAPRMLELELTESAIMDSVERMVESMQALKDLGVALALDDFGTGFSSLNHLKRLPLHKLKIDQSFVRELTHDAHDAAITRAIIAMAHQLQLTVTAEGVETEAQLGYLRRNHCDDVQGMLLSPPLAAAQIDAILHNRRLKIDIFETTQPSRRLLLLDDDENILRALVRVLRRDGYRIYTATTAAKAFDLLGRHAIQVIISDERMPDVRGTVFLSQVKDMYPETIRIVLSGYADLTSVTEAINCGAIYKFLTKPWDDDDLRAQIRAAFRAHFERTGEQLSVSDAWARRPESPLE
jgi:diguanylate cyclase (GGDEF)-like protein/PAS domain S-box-containing protein